MQNASVDDLRGSPLWRLHQELGAVLPEISTTNVIRPGGPAHFGSESAEYQQLRSGCGLIDTSDRSILVLTGADRARFLNGMVTGDVSNLQAGQGLYCFFTTAKGRVLSDVVVAALSEKLVLILPPWMATEIEAHLSKYVVADRVDFAAGEDLVAVKLLGPTSAQCLRKRALEAELPEGNWRNHIVVIEGIEALVVAEDVGDLTGFTVLVERGQAEALGRSLLCSEASHSEPLEHSIMACGSAALETARIEMGTLKFGKDFSVDNFPKETGIDAAVSYTKGCYLGQEVVARIHYRGQVNHAARGLLFEGEASPEGTVVQSEGRDIGLLSSATLSPLLKRGIGLSILLRSSAEPGSRVELTDEKTAEVVELPFDLAAL